MQIKQFLSGAHARARATDPLTSFESAESIKDAAQKHAQIILDCLRAHGALGKDGISRLAGLDSMQVARRLHELERDGYIKLTGNTVKSKSNRNEREWSLKHKD